MLKASSGTRDGSKETADEVYWPTRGDNKESTEESSQPTGDDEEESSEKSSHSTIEDNKKSKAISFQFSHDTAKRWFTAGTKSERTRSISNDIVAHTMYDILAARQFFIDVEKDDTELRKEYELDVKNILKPKKFT